MPAGRDKLVLILADIALFMFAVYLGIVVRFEGPVPEQWIDPPHIVTYFCMAFLAAIAYGAFGLYGRVWRYVGMHELLAVVTATSLAVAPFMIVAVWSGGTILSRSITFNTWLMAIALVGGVRLLLRMAAERRHGQGAVVRRALIVGANDVGELILRDLQRQSDTVYRIIGFIDDAPERRGLRIHGVPVLGTLSDVPNLLKGREVDEIIVAEARPAVLRQLVTSGELGRTQLRMMPSLSDVLQGRVQMQTREVRIEDLLEREPVQTDTSAVSSYIEGRTVLVTGAGGSIGSEICRQVAALKPSRLVLLGRGENSIYEIALELKRLTDVPLETVIADIRDTIRIRSVFECYRPNVIFHAAAHKHVPLMEANPGEAVTVNVLGTHTLLQEAARVGAERFVLLSTDKAVRPGSFMGASKRLAEKVLQEFTAGHPQLRAVAVRFGNVLDSRGSVIPTFRRQIAMGGPVTVTDANMTRFFMTIPEAVQLVLQAASLARGGEVYILDMGQPVRILDLARNVIRLSGFEPDKDIGIQITGLRPGEKMSEELLNPDETSQPTAIDKVLLVARNGAAPGSVLQELPQLVASATEGEVDALRQMMARLGGFS